MLLSSVSPDRNIRSSLLVVAGALLLQFGLIGAVFKHAIPFQCHGNWPERLCYGLDGALLSLYGVISALVLVTIFRPETFAPLRAAGGVRRWPLAANLAGIAIALAPIVLLQARTDLGGLAPALACWVLGSLLILFSALRWLADAGRWRAFFRHSVGWLFWPALLGGLMPLVAAGVEQLWQVEAIASRTFEAVVWTVSLMGYEVSAWPATREIGADGFLISVAPTCSGVEGLALVTLFTTLYLALFRHELRFPLALILYPAGIALSLLFNVVRISVLIAIGLEGYPELAVGGFHSHAGWLMFTIVSLGIVAAASAMPGLRRPVAVGAAGAHARGAPPLPLRTDPVAARIVPFFVFMLSAAIIPAVTQQPGTLYPLRVVAVIAALALFLPVYRAIAWRVDPLAVSGGLVIALLWIVVPTDPVTQQPYGALAGAALILWYVARAIGTSILVPVLEELFFRDYLESRLRIGTGTGWSIVAALVSGGIFAVLHDRWAEAFVAALIFSALARRNGRIADAIVAHAVANAAIFAYAAATRNFAII